MKNNMPKVIAHTSPIVGLAFWRVLWPMHQLSMRREVACSILQNYIIDALPYLSSDVILLQRFAGKVCAKYMENLVSLREKGNFRIIYDVDDILFFDDVPDYHYGKKMYKTKNKNGLDISEMRAKAYEEENYTKELMELCDEITVSTPFLKDFCAGKIKNKNITVLPNKIPFFWAGSFYSEEILLRNYKKNKSRPRILYAGSSSHVDCEEINKGKDDFSLIIDVIIKTRKEFCWVFIGACPIQIKEYTKTGEMEYWNWSPIGLLPQNIAEREGNMMVAPLADNIFNHAKSNIKFLEACAQGLPIACQDLTPYKEAPIRFNSGEEMIEKIRETLKSEESFLEHSRKARQIADDSWLEVEGNISAFRDVYTYPFGDPRRSI